MRQTLTNYAVARRRKKRGGTDPIERALEFYDQRKIDVTALDSALHELETLDPRQGQIVELRFFGGLTVAEMSTAIGISPTRFSTPAWHQPDRLSDRLSPSKQ
jgi:RNA polymerase sigma-70 factor, ECF subfamily